MAVRWNLRISRQSSKIGEFRGPSKDCYRILKTVQNFRIVFRGEKRGIRLWKREGESQFLIVDNLASRKKLSTEKWQSKEIRGLKRGKVWITLWIVGKRQGRQKPHKIDRTILYMHRHRPEIRRFSLNGR